MTTKTDLRPPAALRLAVWGGTALLGLSGLLLALPLGTGEVDPGPSWEAVHLSAARVHGALAMAFCVALGTAASHIKAGLKAGRNTAWGLLLLACLMVLLVSAWGLYYLPVAWHGPVAQAHLWCGIVLPILIFVHALKGRR